VSCFFMRMFVLEIASHPSTHTHFQSHTKKTCKRSRCPFTVSYVFFRTILIVEQVRVVFGIPQTKGFFLSKNTSKSANSLPKARPKKKTKNKKEKRKKKKEKKEQNRGYEEECSKKNKQIQRRGCVFARYPLSKFSFFFLLMTNHGTLSPMVL